MGSFQSTLRRSFELKWNSFNIRWDENLEVIKSGPQPQRQESVSIQVQPERNQARSIAIRRTPCRSKCAVCNMLFHPPIRVLQCGHCFCHRCLFRLRVSSFNRRSIRCASCRQMTNVPWGNLRRLPPNVELERLLEEMGMLGPYEVPTNFLLGRTIRENNSDVAPPAAQWSPEAIRLPASHPSRSDDTLANVSSASLFSIETGCASGSYDIMSRLDEPSLKEPSLSCQPLTRTMDESVTCRFEGS